MNNPLAQKYQYYLNESHRLNEELKSEQEYSEILESLLADLLINEQIDESWKKNLLASLAGLGMGFSGGAAVGSAPHVFSPATTSSIEQRIQDAETHRADAVGSALKGAAAGGGLGAIAATVTGKKKKKNK